jgi:hypothetical protein
MDSDFSKRSSKQSNESELILTPGGWRPRSKVHLLKPGQHVSGKGGKLRVIDTQTGKVVKEVGRLLKKKLIKNPGRRGSLKSKAPGAPGPLPAPGTGWIVNSGWTNTSGKPISYFSTRWVVPPPPATDNGQLIYLFNGIEPAAENFILQPVLQWGESNAGGGSNWSITNWFVGSDGSAIFKALSNVNPGDVVRGIMTLTGHSGSDFSYLSSFEGFPSADLQVTDVDELVWANEALEAYELTAFSDYPNAVLTAFYDIEIKLRTQETPSIIDSEATINWAASNKVTDNGQKCVIVSNDSPGGVVYLYYRSPTLLLYFVTDKSTFGKDEVNDAIAHSGGTFSNAFWLVLEGFTINQITVDQPSPIAPVLSGAFKNLAGVSLIAGSPEYERPDDLTTPQRIRYPFDIQFASSTLAAFPASGVLQQLLSATITVAGNVLTAQTLFELVAGADPYFTDIDPAQNNVFWLSQDLRVFTATPGQNNVPVAGGPVFSSDSVAGAFSYIQDLISHLNANYSNPAGTDPFNSVLPGQSGVLTGDSSVTPFTFDFSNFFSPQAFANYNFAVARVRLRGTAGPAGAANDVKVFFRLWSTETADTDYQDSSTYLSNFDTNGLPDSPLVGSGHHTIPFFATGNLSGNTDYSAGGVNNRMIQINSGNSIWAYFGCFLNLYDSGNLVDGQQIQQWLNGTHHCIVAQIAYDDAPIVNSNGVVMSPANSDKLAQRNLHITLSNNPGEASTHRIPQTFDTRPSQPLIGAVGTLLDYPDELMIDWGKTPVGSIANIYWPQVNASEVLLLASKMYGSHQLTAADANTIQCPVTNGVTYIPIPPGSGENFAGLFTVDLPTTVVKGQEFNIIVRRVTTRRGRQHIAGGGDAIRSARAVSRKAALAVAVNTKGVKNWRYVVGTFQVRIPVTTQEVMLLPEQNTLAIMKWRLQQMAPTNRWYPVLQRYISYISGRVAGLGGNPDAVPASPNGAPIPGIDRGKVASHTGKIRQVSYNCFGEFEGFVLESCNERRSFKACEKGIAEVVLRACRERITVTVVVESAQRMKIRGIIIHCCGHGSYAMED